MNRQGITPAGNSTASGNLGCKFYPSMPDKESGSYRKRNIFWRVSSGIKVCSLSSGSLEAATDEHGEYAVSRPRRRYWLTLTYLSFLDGTTVFATCAQ
jgi:hypothetical protein